MPRASLQQNKQVGGYAAGRALQQFKNIPFMHLIRTREYKVHTTEIYLIH
jgi:hypothetical protein